jgi:hypothetical protein
MSKLGTPGFVLELPPKPTHPMWKHSAVLTGGPWGNLWLPDDVNVTTDRDLLQIGLVTGCPPFEIGERRLLVIELGYVGTKNMMASGMLTEILLCRRDMVGMPTWLLLSEDPALDPGHVFTGRNRKIAEKWRSIRLTDHTPGSAELETTIRVPGRRRAEPEMEPEDVDDMVEEQLEGAWAP